MGLVRNALSLAKDSVRAGRDDELAHQREQALRDEVHQLSRRIDRLESQLRKLEKDAVANPDGPAEGRFHAGMTIAEVREAHHDADEVLARFHLGGCASCAVSSVETLGEGAQLHQVDLDGLLADLNNL